MDELKLKVKYNIKHGVKFPYEYVKEYFALYGYTLLSKEYIDRNIHLDYICPKGHKHKIGFGSFRQGSRCYYCSHGNFTMDDVLSKLRRENYTLLDPENYETSNSRIKLRCSKGHEYETIFKAFTRGARCKKCLANLLRLDFNVIINEAKKRGHTVLSQSKDYRVAKSKLKIKCQDGHIFETTWDAYFHKVKKSKRSNGCRECGRIKNSLTGNYNYKGFRPVKLWARTKLFDWKKAAMERANYTCSISSKTGRLEIHHPENFSKLFYKAIDISELPDMPYLKDYTDKQLLNLEATLIGLHEKEGIPMLKHIHKLFHHIYGNQNNTMEQVKEFKKNYYIKEATNGK